MINNTMRNKLEIIFGDSRRNYWAMFDNVYERNIATIVSINVPGVIVHSAISSLKDLNKLHLQ